MGDFSPDPVFVQRAVIAIRELERLVLETPRANHRLDNLVKDLDAVHKRYVRGEHCHTCESRAVLPEIQFVIFCSEDCRRLSAERESQTEALIQEAISEHLQ